VKRAGRYAAIGLLALVAFVALALLMPAARPAVAPLLADHVIANVRVVDVRAGVARPAGNVVIRGGRIASMGADAPAGLHRIDARGGFLIPGLWDMHNHSWQVSPQMHFPLQIANGVVAVRDMMDCPHASDSLIACLADKRRWSAEADAGRRVAPRFIGVGSFYLESPEITPQKARSLVRDYRARGIDYIKVYNRLSPAAYAAATAEAARVGMPVVGHLPKQVPLSEALRRGQNGFDHAHLLIRACSSRYEDWVAGRLDRLSPMARDKLLLDSFDASKCASVLAAMRGVGAWFVPTHVTREEDARAGDPTFVNDPRLAYADPLSRWAYRDDLGGTRGAYPGREGERLLQAYFRQGLKLTGQAHRAGVRVLAGTDAIIGGLRMHDELGHLVAAGLTPAEALRAATLDPAEYAGMSKESGSIEPGRRADLVLLRANPLERIGHSRDIEAVFLNGRHYDRERLDGLLAFARAQANTPANWIKMLWGFARSSVSSEL
jgi:hypothetical protein